MDVILRVAVPVGVVRSRHRPQCFSAIVKLTYELGSSGDAPGLAAEQEPLSNGEDEDGMVRPSDFAETKSACDVVLTGRALVDVGSMRLRVGAVDRSVPRASMLGSIQASAEAPCAPPEQRIPFPGLPLEVLVHEDGQKLEGIVPGPVPAVAVIEGDWSTPVAVPMRADTVLVDSSRGTCSLVFRGEFQLSSPDAEAMLVVDALGRLSKTPTRELKRWPRRQVIEPDEINLDDDDLEITRGGSVAMPRAAAPPVRASFDDEQTRIVPEMAVRKTRTVRMRISAPAIDVLAAVQPAGEVPARLPEHHTLPAVPLWVTPPTGDPVDSSGPPTNRLAAAADAASPSPAADPPPAASTRGQHDAHTRPMPIMDSLAARLARASRPDRDPPEADGMHSMPTVEMPALSADLAAARPTQNGASDARGTSAPSIEVESVDTDEEQPAS